MEADHVDNSGDIESIDEYIITPRLPYQLFGRSVRYLPADGKFSLCVSEPREPANTAMVDVGQGRSTQGVQPIPALLRPPYANNEVGSGPSETV